MKKTISVLLVLLIILAVFPVGVGGWNAPAMAASVTIKQIAAGDWHSLALLSDGSLYAWGSNSSGQLGGSGSGIIKVGIGFTAIAAGGSHSLALRGDTLYAWGANGSGQLGDVTNTSRNTPVKIGTGFTAIAAGGSHSLALKGNTLYAWGYNGYGQLGDETYTNKNTPVKIGIGFTAIAAGRNHSLALKGNTLFTWGRNDYGQLGDETNNNKNKPMQMWTGNNAIAAGDLYSLSLKGNSLYAWGNNYSGQPGVELGIGYTAIAAGPYHSLALKGNVLFAWGNNGFGQLGDETNTSKDSPIQIGTGYISITVGYYHSLALKGNTLFAWGYNNDGQLGDGTYTRRNTPTEVKFPVSLAPTPTNPPVDPGTDITNTDYSVSNNETISKSQTYKSITINKATLTITKNGNVTVDKSLVVKKGGTLIVKGKLYVAGSLTLENGASLQMVVEDNKIMPSISVKGTMVINSENITIGKGTIEVNSFKASDAARKSILVQMKQTTNDSIITVLRTYRNDKDKDKDKKKEEEKEKIRVLRVNEAIQSMIFNGISINKKIPAKFEFSVGEILRNKKKYGYQIEIIAKISVSLTEKNAAYIFVKYTEGAIECTYQCTKIGGKSIESFLKDVQTELKDYAYEVAKEQFIEIIFAKNNVVFMCGSLPSQMTEIVLSSKEVYDQIESITKEVLTVKKQKK